MGVLYWIIADKRGPAPPKPYMLSFICIPMMNPTSFCNAELRWGRRGVKK